MRLGQKMAMLGAGVITLAGIGAASAAIGDAAATPRTAPVHLTSAGTLHSGDQSGDQSGPDTTAGDTPEATGGAEAPGDTHADAPGQNVDHQCPPACDTANGETP